MFITIKTIIALSNYSIVNAISYCSVSVFKSSHKSQEYMLGCVRDCAGARRGRRVPGNRRRARVLTARLTRPAPLHPRCALTSKQPTVIYRLAEFRLN
ncbi:unnamed protein product [Euphydryas editha]|uniref:Secreted protein n=1 Tax=Euphydryas editha TaxID=104508 RepID=A0AAU9UC46_EUPED|nr:unnamed protein product [Euphydryas editha]